MRARINSHQRQRLLFNTVSCSKTAITCHATFPPTDVGVTSKVMLPSLRLGLRVAFRIYKRPLASQLHVLTGPDSSSCSQLSLSSYGFSTATPHVRVADPASIRASRSSGEIHANAGNNAQAEHLRDLIRTAGTDRSSNRSGTNYDIAPAVEQFCDACRRDAAGSARVWTAEFEEGTVDRALRSIMQHDGDGLRVVMQQRAHLVRLKRQKPEARATLGIADEAFKNMLGVLFSPSLLTVKRIDLSSPGTLLEKIIRYEKVRPYNTLDHLKRRLGPGRRCFALFHPSIPGARIRASTFPIQLWSLSRVDVASAFTRLVF